MIIKQSQFKPAPEGIHKGVCVDVADLGLMDTQWGKKQFIRLVWELDVKMDNGKPFIINKRYTPSLNAKSTLHKDLKSWRGKAFTADELEGFDLEDVIGAPCQILVQHNEKDGNVYSNIAAITKNAGEPLKACGSYVRMKDREEEKIVEAPHYGNPAEIEADEPF